MKIAKLVMLVSTLLLTGCDQMLSRNFGGTMTVDVPNCERVVDVTWKADEFWYATRPMRPGETPEHWTFRQQRMFNITGNGVVVLQEGCESD